MRRLNRFLSLILVLCVALAFVQNAGAHTRSQSQSSWVIEGDTVTGRVEVEAIDVTRLYALGGEAPLADLFAAEARDAFSVRAAGAACDRTNEPAPIASGVGRYSAIVRFTCPAGALARGPIELESRLFLRVAPSHLHFAAMRDSEGRTAEAVLSESNPRAALSLEAAPAAETFWGAAFRFIPIGATHVWSGLDHIAFMLALVLLVGGRWRATVFAATGFTLGHTATLGLAATGVLAPDVGAIEALIGFTIAFVALEIGENSAVAGKLERAPPGAHSGNTTALEQFMRAGRRALQPFNIEAQSPHPLTPSPSRGGGPETRLHNWSVPLALALAIGGVASVLHLIPMSPFVWFGLAAFVFAYPRGFPRDAAWLAAIFGLIHGCGFAGALSALDLPKPRLLASLLGFNVGVELGQIVVIGVALIAGLVLRGYRHRLPAHALSIAGAALFALGGYWFVLRLLA